MNLNRANYDDALRRVLDGRWSVDPEKGLVFGVRRGAFTRHNSSGYIQIKFRDALNYRVEHAVLAHRVLWEAVHGPLADALTINHVNGVKDDNRSCNLEAVSLLENVRHARRTGLTPTLRGAQHGMSRLSAATVAEIARLALDGQTNDQLAAAFGISKSHASNIRRGTHWSQAATTG